MNTIYLNNFLQAFSRGKSKPINAVFDSDLDARFFRKIFNGRKNIRVRDEIIGLIQVARLVHQNRLQIGAENTSQCHVVCSDLMINFINNKMIRPGLASITIGDVKLDGVPLYGCSPQSITKELTYTTDQNKGLDMHFWITCIDMTVIDLTLPYNLHKRGRCELAERMGVPYVCDPTNLDNPVTYIPMVVDNESPGKVDDLYMIS